VQYGKIWCMLQRLSAGIGLKMRNKPASCKSAGPATRSTVSKNVRWNNIPLCWDKGKEGSEEGRKGGGMGKLGWKVNKSLYAFFLHYTLHEKYLLKHTSRLLSMHVYIHCK
jgi:hypothetical protein